jgi:SAM-dependent methyltransferase
VLQEKALPGLHASVLRELEPRLKARTRVIDLGAGTGAWSKRLLSFDAEVTAVDVQEAAFEARGRGIRFIPGDLNGDFAARIDGGPYDLVTSIEVIEHLENPRHFLREARKLVSDDGWILITTPNIECVPGRLRFLWNGQLRMFGPDPEFNEMTHITPIHTLMFRRMLDDTGLRLVRHSYNREAARGGSRVSRLAAAVLGRVVRGETGGDNHIFIVEKARR